jgi:hypothetical protein
MHMCQPRRAPRREPTSTRAPATYEDGELERKLVVVGDGTSSSGMSAEQAQTVDLQQGAKAQGKTARPASKGAAL